MAKQPTLTDYVALIMHLFEQFMQHRIEKEGINETKLLTYSTPSFIVFFMVMQFRGIYAFKTRRNIGMAMAYPSPRSVANARLATATPSHHHCPSL